MNVSHVTGGGLGVIVGALLAGILGRYGLHVSDTDAALIGSTATATGVALAHALDKYGIAGLGRVLLNGTPKKPVKVVVGTPPTFTVPASGPGAVTTPAPPQPPQP